MNRAALFSLLVMVAMLAPGCLTDEVDESIDELEPERYVAVMSPAEIALLPYDVRNFTVVDVTAGTNDTERPWSVYGTENIGQSDEHNYGGNCCEHYLATDEEGIIYNFGGEWPWWSMDRGITWDEYRPDLVNWDATDCEQGFYKLSGQEGLGEGSVIQTPNGDIIAMGWFPYPSPSGGDQFYAFLGQRQSNGDVEWSWCYNVAHEPFYDRSWQVPVIGPIDPPPQFATVLCRSNCPWASIVVSNFWSYSTQGYQISVDGLNYRYIEIPDHDSNMPVDIQFDLLFDDLGPEWDYMTPHREIRAMPIPSGGVLFPRWFDDGTNLFLDTNLEWHKHTLLSGEPLPSSHLAIDSTGALHSLRREGQTLIYNLSLDGGNNWTTYNYTWPEATTTSDNTFEWDFQADGSRDLAVISMRVQTGNDTIPAADVDLVYHIRGYRENLTADTVTRIGLGDLDATSGAGNDIRFDFSSLAILPDGGVVVAYADSTDVDPLFAIELELPESYFEEY